MHNKITVGIDVSKATLDVTRLPGGEHQKLSNTRAGIVKLVEILKKIAPDMVVLEATGGYQRAVVEALQTAEIPVNVANPRQVRDFARSLNKLCKTDKVDASVLAQYAQSRELALTMPRSKNQITMSELLLRRNQLIEMIVAENNHLEQAPPVLASGIKELVTLMKRQMSDCDKEIRNIINSDDDFRRLDKIIQSVPGLGPVVSARLIAELPELGTLNRKQIAALVGVAPFNRDSGGYRGQRHIWAGRAKIRCALYAAMRAALRCNPRVRGWFDNFINHGKAYKVAVIACIRKLLVILNSMVRSDSVWFAEPSVFLACGEGWRGSCEGHPQKCPAARTLTTRRKT